MCWVTRSTSGENTCEHAVSQCSQANRNSVLALLCCDMPTGHTQHHAPAPATNQFQAPHRCPPDAGTPHPRAHAH